MMKQIFIASVILINLSQLINSQEYTEKNIEIVKKQEVRVNALTFIANRWADASYEYLLSEEASVGINLQVGFGELNDDDLDNSYRLFSVTPYYRRYFSSDYAQGFFVEGFGMYHIYEENETNIDTGFLERQEESEFSLGISVGGKWVTNKGFVFEIFGGIGADLLTDSDGGVAGRYGIAVGYRF